MSSTLRKLKSYLSAQTTDADQIAKWLEAASIPISNDNCRTCADPCDEGHDEFPSKFDVDRESQMLGSVKPFRRQVVISTGKSDWEKDVTSVQDSLAAHLLAASASSSSTGGSSEEPGDKKSGKSVPGVFTHLSANRIAILNGSLNTISHDTDKETVLVFPDYKVVYDVDRSLDGAAGLWASAIDPAVDLTPTTKTSLTIPYSCVILICSHKKRDNRCHIASGTLEHGLLNTLQSHGWEANTQIDHCHLHDSHDSPAITTPKTLADLKRALIVRVSHIGGHKYAGNVIINTPQGNSIWYGRVTPHDVDSIVKTTIIDGKLIPSLLRGGMNISKPNCKSLHDW